MVLITKLIWCKACQTGQILKSDSSLTQCECGKVQGWWHDSENGLAAVFTASEDDRPLARVVSLHNGFLNEAENLIPSTYYDQHTNTQLPYPETEMDVHWRAIHQQACVMPRQPETVRIFDQSRRNCWAVIMVPGQSLDVRWATSDEARAKRFPTKVTSS